MFRRILIGVVPAVALLAVLFFLFGETRQLTGSVRDAATNAPIEGATIKISDQSAKTNAQGQYTIAVARGKMPVDVSADGYAPQQATLNGDDLSARTFTLDLLLTPNRVTGSVRDAEMNAPLANAQILIGDQPVSTNAQGVFEARGVKTGTSITAQMPGYSPIAVKFEGQSNFDLALAPNTVTASVIDQYTNQPVVKAQIRNGDPAMPVDATGRAMFKRVKTGATLRASAPGYEPGSAIFTGGGDVQIALRPNTLDGVVTDAATGQPISGTLVYSGTTIVSTDAKGAYHLDNVPAKTALSFKVPGYRKTQIEVSGVTHRDIKLAPFLVKAIHIPFGLPAERVRELMDMVNKTELNAIVIDVKSEKGRLGWDSQVPLAKEISAPSTRTNTIDLLEVVERCKTQNIYCIARLAVFQDTLLAGARPNLAIRNLNGTVFTENGGQQWLNPYNTDNWTYNLALTKEIVALGFDEIQFDYVRFPGRITGVAFGTDYTEDTRVAAIAGFLARAQKELRPTGVFVSADVFGLTTATEDDQGTGQRLRDLGAYVDYISPMVYPDTWVGASDLLTSGLGIRNCTVADLCPYDIVYNSYKRATEKTSAKVRLWLQAYQGHGDFGVPQYRLQRKAANDAGSIGWMFWSGTGTYDIKTFDPPAK
jgi:hypothetical protein